jgi:hypothetical protein
LWTTQVHHLQLFEGEHSFVDQLGAQSGLLWEQTAFEAPTWDSLAHPYKQLYEGRLELTDKIELVWDNKLLKRSHRDKDVVNVVLGEPLGQLQLVLGSEIRCIFTFVS